VTPVVGLYLLATLGLLAGAVHGSEVCVVGLLAGFLIACGTRHRSRNVIPFCRRPIANPPVWNDGRTQTVFASVPGRCRCGSGRETPTEPRNAEVPLTKGQEHCDA